MTALAALLLAAAVPTPVCTNATGTQDGFFYSVYRDGGTGCMTLNGNGRYTTRWALGAGGNLVAGTGWAVGSTTRILRYRASRFDPGRNGYLALYGWSTDPLVEYYVVDNWGAFTPPGPAAIILGTVRSDGGTYRLYRTRRIAQPSIQGTATFDQYWSVRTARRPLGRINRITFANHVRAWRARGLVLGTLHYQILATEGFGSTGGSAIEIRPKSAQP